MSPAYVHLLLNHIPTLGTIFGLALLVAGLIARKATLERAGFVTFVITAMFSLVVYLTGEGAEEVAEHLPGVTHELIEAHEEAAGTAMIIGGVMGLAALVGLFGGREQERIPSAMRMIVLVLALGVVGLMGYTAMLGGRVRHTEIRPGATGEQTTDSTYRFLGTPDASGAGDVGEDETGDRPAE